MSKKNQPFITIEELLVIFKEYDKNQSNTLTFEELSQLCFDYWQVEVDVKVIKAIFKDIDSNKDKSITFEEFLGWYRAGMVEWEYSSTLKHSIALIHEVQRLDKQLGTVEKDVLGSAKNNMTTGVYPFLNFYF
jgi:hypothetical protein